jgi:Cortical protein marker for cell polarity
MLLQHCLMVRVLPPTLFQHHLLVHLEVCYPSFTLSPHSVSVIVVSATNLCSLNDFCDTSLGVLAVGVVILISIAIAAGVVFFLALVGIIWTLFSRRDDKLNKLDGGVEDDDDSAHHRPSSLLEHINAATRTTILGTSPFGNINTEKAEGRPVKEAHDPFGPDASNYIRAETPSDAVGGLMTEETSRPAHARYSFDGAGEGELPISTGAEVEVLDDRDPA